VVRGFQHGHQIVHERAGPVEYDVADDHSASVTQTTKPVAQENTGRSNGRETSAYGLRRGPRSRSICPSAGKLYLSGVFFGSFWFITGSLFWPGSAQIAVNQKNISHLREVTSH
jgi:hypothetical protein